MWLQNHLQSLTLEEGHEDYLLGRAMPEWMQGPLKPKTWSPLPIPVEADGWSDMGAKGQGEYLDGRLILPLWSPRGALLGFESRTERKKIIKYFLPEADWSPTFVGMSPLVMERLWAGGDLWLAEGFFDVFPLWHILPSTDAVLGTLTAKLSRRHLDFCVRFCRGWVHVVYDNDDAGRKGAHTWVNKDGRKVWGAVEKLRHAGLKARSIPYDGKDPGEVWSNFGLPGLRTAFAPFLR